MAKKGKKISSLVFVDWCDRFHVEKIDSTSKMAAVRREVDDLLTRCSLCCKKLKISLRHITAVRKMWTNSCSRHAKDRLGHCLQCNNIRETPPNGERCRLLLSLHVRKKLPCRVLDSDDGRWSFSRKGTALDVKPDWKACTQYWQPVVGLNCWGVGHLAQSFC